LLARKPRPGGSASQQGPLETLEATVAEPVPIRARPWYRALHWTMTLSATGMFVYGLAAGFGLSSTVLLGGSIASMLWSQLAGRRQMEEIAWILVVQSAILLVWSLVVFVQTY